MRLDRPKSEENLIALTRNLPVPAILVSRGGELTNSVNTAVAADLEAYRRGEKKIGFDGRVYGHPRVKAELLRMQREKCCFCESKITHIDYGDVEHYRPKGAWKQAPAAACRFPGYYWLAYEWRNLLLCCGLCNQRFKGNLFPLRDPSKRALSPNDDLTREEPMLINPASEDPASCIGFRGDTPYPINGDDRARLTISVLGLNRKALRERRLERLNILKIVFLIASGRTGGGPELRGEATALLQRASEVSAEYSAAVKSSIRDEFEFV
jgi:uncharacterized protein (TIGR02646 family)